MALTMHKVAGVYPDRIRAREGVRALHEAGFPKDAIALLDRKNWQRAFTHTDEMSARSRKVVLTWAGAGAAIGAVVAAILSAAGVSFVAAAPVFSIFAGAGLGAILATALTGLWSASAREPDFRNMVREAVESDQAVVIVRAKSEVNALEAQGLFAHTAEQTIDQYGSVSH